MQAITEDDEGKPRFLKTWEASAASGVEVEDLPPEWKHPSILEWLTLDPPFADMDLRGVVHVSREHTPIVTLTDRLSTEATTALSALLELRTAMNEGVTAMVQAVPLHELPRVTDKLLERAKQEQEWGTPPIFFALLTVARVDPDQANRFAAFLAGLPGPQVKPPIIPRIKREPWAETVFSIWEKTSGVSQRVKATIKSEREDT